MNRKIIIALIIIVLIALAGLISFSSGIKSDTQINFLTGMNLKNGDQIQFELKDAQGRALADQEIKITFKGENETQNFTITTDEQGKGALILKDENSGNYTISVSYGGDDKHNGCSANQKIIIKGNEGTAGNSTYDEADYSYDTSSDDTSDYSYSYTYSSDSSYSSESSQSSSSSSNVIQGGQNDGIDADYLNTHQQRVVDGSLE